MRQCESETGVVRRDGRGETGVVRQALRGNECMAVDTHRGDVVLEDQVSWERESECEMRDARCEMRDARCEMRDARCECECEYEREWEGGGFKCRKLHTYQQILVS